MSDWRDQGLCAWHPDPELWHPDPSDHTRILEAVVICRQCPVRDACTDYAIRNRIDGGIWGGLTEDTRRAMRRNGGAAPVCRNGHPRTPENTGRNRRGGKACLICAADGKKRNQARSTA